MWLDTSRFDDYKRHYDTNGFLHLPALLSPAELNDVNRELERYTRDVAPALPPADIVWEAQPDSDGARRIRNLWRMEQHSPFFARFGMEPAMLDLARLLVNGEPLRIAVELFAKPARVGSAVPYHQDNAYFTLSPPDCFTLWIALDASTRENGCVYYARGSHRGPLFEHGASGVLGNSMMATHLPPDLDEVPGILAAGDAMAHHAMTLHRSEPNRSDKPRRGLLLVYRAAHCRVDEDYARHYRAVRDALAQSSPAQ
jgi:hypothetical protein